MALVKAIAQIGSLAQELPYTLAAAEKEKKKKKKKSVRIVNKTRISKMMDEAPIMARW